MRVLGVLLLRFSELRKPIHVSILWFVDVLETRFLCVSMVVVVGHLHLAVVFV